MAYYNNIRKEYHYNVKPVMLFLMQLHLLFLWSVLCGGYVISKPNCTDHCGEVEIPYPFGIGANCYHDEWYEITCNKSLHHAGKPFLRKLNLEVFDINWYGRRYREEIEIDENYQYYYIQILRVGLPPRNFCEGNTVVNSTDLHGSPYRYSRQYNVLMVEGCGGSVVLKNISGEIITGCASGCAQNGPSTNLSNCYGNGCCQSSLTSSYYSDDVPGLEFYQMDLDQTGQPNLSTCDTSVVLIESVSIKNLFGKLSDLKSYPMVLEWSSNFLTSDMLGDHDNFSCPTDNNTYQACSCNGFPNEGNPYLPNGCQVVKECRKCRRRCGYHTKTGNYYCKKNKLLKLASIFGFSIGVGLVLLVLGCFWLYKFLKRRKAIKQKAKYFKKNGGLLLQQQMSSSEGVVEKTKIFVASDLEKATDDFSENRILGQGGQGTVYKGMLLDGRIVAVKKSKKVDESQLEQFINEVVILSQINHRNVVKLLGCCLETEVPLLVYEFIPNGTLYQHIHDANDEFHVSWKMRLQIAAESAGAIAYLHSSSSAPIYHRDIKSSNILLDDKYRAKVSDFGTSKAITIEQTHVTTIVLGTYGYLDPEYFQSNMFTDKSDVYSFGVVLVELITGKKPICPTKDGGWISLAVEFLSHMESNSPLSDILDARIADEGKVEEFAAVANLARHCLEMKGKHRPTMKEISIILDGIRSSQAPNIRELSPADNISLVTEIADVHSGPFGVGTFTADDGSPGSMEVQPLMIDTQKARRNILKTMRVYSCRL